MSGDLYHLTRFGSVSVFLNELPRLQGSEMISSNVPRY